MIKKILKIIFFILTVIKAIPRLNYNSLDSSETIKHAVKNKKSIIRWGDGETNLACGRSNHRQEKNKDLEKLLNDLIDNYSEDSPYILGMPNRYLKCKFFSMSIHNIIFWSRSRVYLRKKIKPDLIYGDSFTFRDAIVKQNNISHSLIRKLWQDYDNIVALHSNRKMDKITLSLFEDKKLINVLIPEKNAFLKYAAIQKKVFDLINDEELSTKDTAFVLAGSFTAKLLALDLIRKGFIVFDAGILLKPEPLYKKFNISMPE